MSRIDDLITQYAPAGVEYKALGEVGEFIRGNGLQKKDLLAEGVPAIHYGQVHTVYGVWTKETVSFVTDRFAAGLRKARPGDLVIATTSEDNEAVAKATAWLGDESAAVSGDAYIYRHTLDPKYAAYFFQSERFQEQKKSGITGTKVRRISGERLARIRIPVPSREIQREIVRILDVFTELGAELGAELEARKQQYADYRDTLLHPRTESTEWTMLGDAAKNSDSQRRPITKAARTAGEIPYYGASGVVDHVRDFIFDGDYLLVSEDGANLLARSTPIAFSISGKAWVNNHAHVLSFDTYALRRFVEFYLNSIDLTPYVSAGAQPKLTQASLNRIPIPSRSPGELERIVAILDTFDALVNDLSSGLPAEIEARSQQYAYYRDRLLTFDEAPG